jgi:hypothetical protein
MSILGTGRKSDDEEEMGGVEFWGLEGVLEGY